MASGGYEKLITLLDDPISHAVAALRPGERIEVHMQALSDCVQGFEHNGCTFNPADRILENIIGSGSALFYDIDEHSRTVIFGRVTASENQRRTYISPDRR